ncbi:MAG: SUF system Fe-S cluster assembly regulator [Alphaproteobacteria bacterium]|nr:SUF system Fe-S cluster assembly regulator [Alphaproteobacteria bacterium]
MIKLNRMTDYGAVVLSILAFQWRFEHGVSLSASDISARSGISQASTAKILKMLAAGGLVEATRGKHGGYVLSSAPELVSVAAIIEALEGPIALTACVETSADPCSSRQSCFLSGHWEKVNTAIGSALSAMTLADLIDPEHYFKPAHEQDLQPKHI